MAKSIVDARDQFFVELILRGIYPVGRKMVASAIASRRWGQVAQRVMALMNRKRLIIRTSEDRCAIARHR